MVRNKRVLELAAGTGITSITAGLFASAVTATDVDRGEEPERLSVRKLNISL